MKRLIWLSLSLLTISLFLVGAVSAQQPTPSDDEVNAIAKQLFCPVCESTPLDVCPTQACAQWRDLISLRLSEGWTESQIKQYFVDQYGDRVLNEPPLRGLNYVVYIAPPAIFLIGAFILFRTFRSWRATGEAAVQAEPPAPADEYVARLEEELRKRK